MDESNTEEARWQRERAHKTYLGDSVYAEIEYRGIAGEAMIKLTTNNGYPDDPRNVIYLDKLTYDALTHWVSHIRKEIQNGHKKMGT